MSAREGLKNIFCFYITEAALISAKLTRQECPARIKLLICPCKRKRIPTQEVVPEDIAFMSLGNLRQMLL